MKRKINLTTSIVLLLFFIALFVNVVDAFGVSSPYWKGKPVKLAPGDTGTVDLTLQNMVDPADIEVSAVLKQGSEIASTEDRTYIVKAGTKDTNVPVTIRIPIETSIGTEYQVIVSFNTITSGDGGGGVALGTGIDTTFDVLVVEPSPIVEEEQQVVLAPEVGGASSLWIWIILGAIIVIIIIVIILIRKKKSGNENQ